MSSIKLCFVEAIIHFNCLGFLLRGLISRPTNGFIIGGLICIGLSSIMWTVMFFDELKKVESKLNEQTTGRGNSNSARTGST